MLQDARADIEQISSEASPLTNPVLGVTETCHPNLNPSISSQLLISAKLIIIIYSTSLISQLISQHHKSLLSPIILNFTFRIHPIMAILSNIAVSVLAAEHVYIMVLEMFLWTSPRGLKAFALKQDFAEKTKNLAANQGLVRLPSHFPQPVSSQTTSPSSSSLKMLSCHILREYIDWEVS